MAFNVGALNTFTVLSNKFLDLIVKETTNLDAYTLDFTADVAQFGASVITSLAPELTAQTKATTAAYADNSGQFTNYTTTLNNHIYTQVAISERDLMVSPIKDLEQRLLYTMTYALAKGIEDAAFATMISANFPYEKVIAAADFDVAKGLGVLNTQAKQLGWRQGDQWSLLAPATYLNTLSSQPAVVQSFRNDINETMKTGKIAKAFNFDIYDNERIPATGNLAAVAVRKQGVMIVARALPEVTEFYGAVKSMTAENGLPVRFMMFYDKDYGNYVYRAESLVGASAADPKALIRVKSA